MDKKGTILVIEDHFEEKIGVFKNYLDIEGYEIDVAENLEEANKKMVDLLKKNIIDGIILDFSFPISKEDPTRFFNDVPNGVLFFEKFKFQIQTMQIPVVINTTATEEIKTKYLGDLDHLGTPVYNVNHDANPLAAPTNQLFIKEIFNLFNNRNKMRNQFTKKPKAWNISGSLVKDSNGNYTYRDNRGG